MFHGVKKCLKAASDATAAKEAAQQLARVLGTLPETRMAAGPCNHHIVEMANLTPTEPTGFRIFLQNDSTYAIEVTIPGSFPTIIKSFATEALAEAWISSYRERLLAKATRKSWGRR